VFIYITLYYCRSDVPLLKDAARLAACCQLLVIIQHVRLTMRSH